MQNTACTHSYNKYFILSIIICFGILPTNLASKEALFKDLAWLKLLHYQKTWSGYKSTVDSPYFFFSKNGKTDPASEWEASKDAIIRGLPTVGPHKLHPQCAFPARTSYFRQRLNVSIPHVSCNGIDYWKEILLPRTVSLVFSTAYAGNPASMLGHTFIKLNLFDKKGQVQNDLLNYSASFAAFPEDNVGFLYFIKGLTGQYKGVFSLDPFYVHVATYSYKEKSRSLGI